jgi:peptidyl-prolyl cis-trans isomerase SurA
MKKLLLTLFVVCLGTVSVGRAQTLPVESLDSIVAVIDDDIVLRSELDRDVQMIRQQYASNPQQLPPMDVLERQVLDRLILMKLQVARATSNGVKIPDSEVDQTLGRIAEQNKLTVAQMRQALQAQGQSYDQFRRSVRDQLTVQALQQRMVQSRVQISDAEIDSVIKNGKLRRGQIHLAYILVGLADGATPDQIEEARAKAEDIKAQIDGGLDFAAAAIRFSDAQNALDGGDLGWRPYDQVPAAFADVAEQMQPGQVSVPLRGPNGFHILKLIERRDQNTQLITEYHARHILIKASELTSNEQARATIEGLRARAEAGEDFGKLAKQYSEDTNNANLEGDMGWFPKEGYGSRVAEVLDTLKDNQISQPFETELGWHVLQLLGTRSTDKTQDIERNQARQMLMSRKAEDEYQSFLRQLRSESHIEIRLPGAEGTAATAG